jgi:hypothetical protein
MAVRRPLVVSPDGELEELPAADSLPGAGGSVTMYTIQVDFGPSTGGSRSKTFSVALAGASVGQKVLASVALDMPAGVSEDELEMDMIAVAARVSAPDTLRIIAASVSGRITGKRNINIVLG